MNAALDLASVEDRIQQRRLARYREMMHKAIDAFVDALAEDLVSEKKMTLMDISPNAAITGGNAAQRNSHPSE